jgi:hypothetical protein
VIVTFFPPVPSSILQDQNSLQKDTQPLTNSSNPSQQKSPRIIIAFSSLSPRIFSLPGQKYKTWFSIQPGSIVSPEREEEENPGEEFLPLPPSKFLKETAGLYIQITNLTMTKDITSANPTRKTCEDLSKRR